MISIKHIYLKLKNSSFFSNSFTYLISNLLTAITPFLLVPVLTRLLTPDAYGEVAIFQGLLIGLSSFIGLSAQGAAAVKFYESRTSKREYSFFLGSCFIVLGFTLIIGFFLTLCILPTLSRWLALNSKWIVLSVFVAGSSFVTLVCMGQWQVRKEAKKYGAFQVSQSLLNLLLSLLFVVNFSMGAEGRIYALSLVPIIFCIYAIFLLYKSRKVRFSWRLDQIREICLFGIPLIPHTLGYFLLTSANRFVINNQLGIWEVGIFMTAFQIVAAMGLVFEAINNAFVPWLFEKLQKGLLQDKLLIVRNTYYYFVILLFVPILVFTIAPQLMDIIAGEKYKQAAGLMGWIALGQVFSGMYFMVTNYVFFSKKTGLLSIVTLSSGLINVLLLIYLMPHYGLEGAAISYSISMLLKFLFTWYIANLRHPMPWFTFLSYK